MRVLSYLKNVLDENLDAIYNDSLMLLEPTGNQMATLMQDFPLSATDDQAMLAPFEIWEVPYGNAMIKFHEPLILTPTWMPHDPDEPGDVEYLDVICPELFIDVYAENREELLAWIHSEIFMNWKLFVSKDDSQLNSDTLPIKRKYLAIAEVVDG